MAISEDLVRRAQDYDRRAMEELLADVYPAVYRMAHALTGRPGAGRQVVHEVIRRSLRVLPKWRTGVVPENWFYHHTLLSAREFLSRPPDPRQDLLVTAAPKPTAETGADAQPPTGEIALAWVAPDDASYIAFVRALRNLPVQQAEAFILHHGERLNERLLGVAMDCSVAAAATHLDAARAALNAVTAGRTELFAATMSRAYRALTPPPATITPVTRKYVARGLRPRLFRRIFRIVLLLALLVAAFYVWRERARWLPFVQEMKTRWWDQRGGGGGGAEGGSGAK
jgi:DNA-directed RNA polymerase specialized sigma24 family protein